MSCSSTSSITRPSWTARSCPTAKPCASTTGTWPASSASSRKCRSGRASRSSSTGCSRWRGTSPTCRTCSKSPRNTVPHSRSTTRTPWGCSAPTGTGPRRISVWPKTWTSSWAPSRSRSPRSAGSWRLPQTSSIIFGTTRGPPCSPRPPPPRTPPRCAPRRRSVGLCLADLRPAGKRAGGHLSALEIAPVTGGRDLERFIAFPYAHYRGDPLWVPQLRMDVRTLLSPAKNPFFRHAQVQCFIAHANGRTVGRIAAIQNDAHTREHGDRVGFYGFFESVNDQTVATALFDAAGAWLRPRGLAGLRGPVGPSTNDECGLPCQCSDTPPTLMMSHNPSYYVDLHQRYGFAKAKDLLVYESTTTRLPERIVRAVTVIAQRTGITLRALNMKRFRAEVELVKALYNDAWEKNWGFVPLTEAEIDHLATQLKPIVVPDLVCFAERAGKVIGFAVALPDLNGALRHNPSGRLFPGILKVLSHARKVHRLRILLLGVLKEYRSTGVDALMYHWIWTKGIAHGFTWGEGGWILEDNAAMNNAAVQLGFRPYRTYRIYDKPL